MRAATALYRSRFRPSARLAAPHLMLGFNAFAAETDDEARLLFSSLQQAFLNLRRGRPAKLPPPDPGLDTRLTPVDRALLDHTLACTAVGSPATVRDGIAAFIRGTGADELMITAQIFDHAARKRSFAITAAVREDLARA
jgi:alkanesulfonate monooxygenase SsuD/methylene tetrahydromethanopterin reductase-like flavin-dependent oxidoreductase (luciferase family)